VNKPLLGTIARGMPDDVAALVGAARIVAYEDQGP
jgi:hypothetical protein